MALFSQRKGIRPLSKALQKEMMDDELRNSLWNGLHDVLWKKWSPTEFMGFPTEDAKVVERVVHLIWKDHFKLPVDEKPKFKPGYPGSAHESIRKYFFEGKWWQVYDLIEFIIKMGVLPNEWRARLTKIMNDVMQNENSAYRIVGNEVVEITDEHEIEAVESALDKRNEAIRTHLSQALALLSERKCPDYRNSIKESISAVESACQLFAGKSKGTLGDCLKEIKKQRFIHPAFEQALSKLYGYTSDEGGIRHALTDESYTPSFSDAKFMLVACAAFVNLMWGKASELGIEIKD